MIILRWYYLSATKAAIFHWLKQKLQTLHDMNFGC